MADDTPREFPGIYLGDTNRRALADRLRAFTRNPDPEDLPPWATREYLRLLAGDLERGESVNVSGDWIFDLLTDIHVAGDSRRGVEETLTIDPDGKVFLRP